MVEFNLSNFGEYREHNQLEVKKAKGIFPGSISSTIRRTTHWVRCYGLTASFPLPVSSQDKIIQELKKNPNLSRKWLTQLIPTISEDGLRYHLNKLQEEGISQRGGPANGGYWEITQSHNL